MPAKLAQKIIKKKLLIPLFIFLAFAFFFLGREVVAQVPAPYVNCDDIRSPEFHSLRPYQKSPCNREPTETAQFCGNRLVLTDSVSPLQVINPVSASNCTRIGGNSYRCSYNTSGSATYKIDLSEAELPILGNTEKELDSAEKTNEYVSWYLNGVTGRAEDPPLDLDKEEDVRKLVNFSGPVNKLLPWEIQLRSKYETIKNAGSERHDQIVGCTTLGKITECPGGNEVRLSDLRKNGEPPYPSQYDNFKEFWFAYQEWRGKFCVSIPFTNLGLCLNNPFKPDYLANFYAYVPYSSTEDRVGQVSVDSQSVTPASKDLEISNVRLTTTPAELFFAHTEEVAGLAEKLQLTFVPQGNPDVGGASYVSPAEACDLTNIRSNEGDALFAESIEGNLSYDAEFSCDFEAASASWVPEVCRKDVSVGLGVVTETPKADEIWSRLVAGPSAIFKRIFPKVGIGGAILGLLDMPAATKVTYSGSGVSAGNPGVRSGESAELYFPHIGGVSEYFLKGIQTILRPKGYGEQILSGAPGTFGSGDVDCDQSAPEVSLRGTLDKEETFQLALNWEAGKTGNKVLECYNDVVRRAKDAGVNAALALWVWLHESNASNYDISTQDFGVLSLDGQGFVSQIDGFLARAESPTYKASSALCRGTGVTNDLQAWALIYRSGNCDPNGVGSGFWKDIISQEPGNVPLSVISPGCSLPKSPTDTSCP